MRTFAIASLLLATAGHLTAQAEFSSLFGQSGNEWIFAVRTDASGRIYICGQTDGQIQVTANCLQPTSGGGADAFVACIDPSLPTSNQLVWSTHLGGGGDDAAYDLEVDAAGTTVTVVGMTSSSDFPVQAAHQPQHGGGFDAFVAVFTPAASGAAQLSWSTYLGGANDDFATGVAVQNGQVTVAGGTESIDFPVQAAWQSANGGLRDLFVSQLTNSGAMSWSTYLGGAGQEGELPNIAELTAWGTGPRLFARSAHVAVDDLDRVTIASYTGSPDYPNPNNNVHGPRGGWDLCVTRFDASGSSLLYAGIVSGSWHDYIGDLALDGPDGVLMAVTTGSPDFPTMPASAGPWIALAVQLDMAQNNLQPVTRLAANDTSIALTVYREAAGTIVIGGVTASTVFPVSNGAPMTSIQAWIQPFLARVEPGSSLATPYATYWGGSAENFVNAIVPDQRGGVIAVGGTWALDHPTTPGAFDTTFEGVTEGWVTIHEMLPALVSRYGDASDPCGAQPFLQVNSAPTSGNSGFEVETHGAPPGAVGLLVLGTPLPGGAPVFNVQALLGSIAGTVGTAIVDPDGFASFALPIPSGYVWDGSLGMQSVWLTPASCGAGPFTTSNALR